MAKLLKRFIYKCGRCKYESEPLENVLKTRLRAIRHAYKRGHIVTIWDLLFFEDIERDRSFVESIDPGKYN